MSSALLLASAKSELKLAVNVTFTSWSKGGSARGGITLFPVELTRLIIVCIRCGLRSRSLEF